MTYENYANYETFAVAYELCNNSPLYTDTLGMNEEQVQRYVRANWGYHPFARIRNEFNQNNLKLDKVDWFAVAADIQPEGVKIMNKELSQNLATIRSNTKNIGPAESLILIWGTPDVGVFSFDHQDYKALYIFKAEPGIVEFAAVSRDGNVEVRTFSGTYEIVWATEMIKGGQ